MRTAAFVIAILVLSQPAFSQRTDLSRIANALEGMRNDSIRDRVIRDSQEEMDRMDLASRAQYCYMLAMEMGNRAAAYKAKNDELAIKVRELEAQVADLTKAKRTHETYLFTAMEKLDSAKIEKYLIKLWNTRSKDPEPRISIGIQK